MMLDDRTKLDCDVGAAGCVYSAAPFI